MGDPNGENGSGSLNHIDLPDLYNSSFTPKRPSLVWVKNGNNTLIETYSLYMILINFLYTILDPRDGIYTYTDPNTNDILLESVETRKTEIFVEASNLVMY